MAPAADDATLNRLAAELGQTLLAVGDSIATAESCTGGWIAQCLTSVSGSSAWFERGFVTYSNAAKQELLGVPAELIHEFGAVSRPVVRAMASGALQHSSATHAVAVTGIAGPDGGSPDKPVGTVWIAWASGTDRLDAERYLFNGDREAVRRQTVATAIEGLRQRVSA